MPDMTEFSKKEFPSQTRERLQWQLDAIRANQRKTAMILLCLLDGHNQWASEIYWGMYKHDRDALTRPGGIFTDEQIEVLNEPI